MVKKQVAFLWDESFLWGLMALRVLKKLSLPFDIVTATQIKAGCLVRYKMLFVPGGWAIDKSRALGDEGKEEIRRFIKKGGSYLGFCGGAGLALQVEEGLSLVPVTRKRFEERVPNFSGKIRIYREEGDHPIWKDVSGDSAFHVWWPGQFSILESKKIKVLASYREPESDFFVADLRVNDITDWGRWERSYGINLNPKRLKGEPAILEGRYGNGKVILSYLHLETPDDQSGHVVLNNLWQHLTTEDRIKKSVKGYTQDRPVEILKGQLALGPLSRVKEMERQASEFIDFGQRNFLWFWRNAWLLQWRRGIRGLEYSTVYILIREISELLGSAQDWLHTQHSNGRCEKNSIEERIKSLEQKYLTFLQKARELLMEERYAMNFGLISWEVKGHSRMQILRKKLFGETRHHAGMFRELLDQIDAVLLPILRKTMGLHPVTYSQFNIQ